MMLDEIWNVKLSRLMELEKAEKDLYKAKALIQRLRAINRVLKHEKDEANDIFKKTYHELKFEKRYGAFLLGHRLGLRLQQAKGGE